MRYIKMLGLAAVAATAFMAFAATAPATVLEGSGGALAKGTKIEMTGTNAVLKAGFATIECGHSEADWTTANSGGASETVEGNINSLSFTECNATVNVLKKGKLIIHHTSGSNGTFTSQGVEVTVATSGVSCTYGTPTDHESGVSTTGWLLRLLWHETVKWTRISGGFLCANPATLTITYTVTSPNPLYITAS